MRAAMTEHGGEGAQESKRVHEISAYRNGLPPVTAMVAPDT